MYDHARFNGATWRHVRETPRDRVPERTGTVESIVDQYTTVEDADRVAENSLSYNTNTGSTDTAGSTSDQNPYYGIPLDSVFDRCPYAYRRHAKTQRDWENGPHPVHGPDKSDVGKCTNFGTKDGHSWFCFWHGDEKSRQGKGGALALIAVNEGWTECKYAYRVYDDPELLAAACVAAREKYGFQPENDNGDPALPPVQALYGLLVAAGRDDVDEPERLMYTEDTGETNHLARQVAEQIWEDITLDQVEDLTGL
jgi:hypothetical protein